MGYIDSHAHLCGTDFNKDLATVIAGFSQNDIERVMLICCGDEDYAKALKLVAEYPCFDIAKGIHPESANEYATEDLSVLDSQLSEGKVVLLGEIGLDYYWVKDNKERQKELFIAQLQLADKHQLPVGIHSRDASEDTYTILKEKHNSKRGVMHCYSGSVEMMTRYVKLGYYISLAGPVTFANAKTAKEVAVAVPLDRLLYETDCPYLTPVPFRGKRNDPNYVRYTAKKIAELKNISIEALNEQVKRNYYSLLGVKNA